MPQKIVRRLIGNGAVSLWRAREEVLAATDRGRRVPVAPDLDDALDARSLPSAGRYGLGNRMLAEIDEEGFAFAVNPEDRPMFNKRDKSRPRPIHQLQIVLHDGRICVRKRFRGPSRGMTRFGRIRLTVADQAKRHAWAALGLWFYVEAAALLRLAQLPFVPKLRGLDVERHEVFMDYLPGDNLRQLAAAQGQPVYDVDVGADPSLASLGADELTAREVRLVDAAGLGNYRAQVHAMVAAMNDVGVAPLDIKPGNLLRGARTQRLYWLDFERARLKSQPAWDEGLRQQDDLIRRLFGEPT
jgi:hypothetical protein